MYTMREDMNEKRFLCKCKMKKKLSRPKNKDDEEDMCGYFPGT